MQRPFIEASSLSKSYLLPRTRLFGARTRIAAVRDVSFEVAAGEVVGVVGESGSGKSTLARMLVGLTVPDSGSVRIAGRDVAALKRSDEIMFRRDIQIVFQDPFSSLDPRMKVGIALREPLRALGIDGSHKERVKEILEAVQLPRDAADKYPHEFSGGQLQRVAIARALAPRPRILVADEPVSALDLSVQAQILNLLLDLRDEFGLTVVLIAHDLGVVHHMAGRVFVMSDGHVVESGPTEDVFVDPRHPYSQRLLSSIIRLDGRLEPLPWRRSGIAAPDGCVFADRCPYRQDECLASPPALAGTEPSSMQSAACHFRSLPIGERAMLEVEETQGAPSPT